MFKNALGAPWQVQKFSEILRPVTCDLRIEWNSTVQDAFGILYKDPCLLFGRSDTDLGRFKNFVRTFARGWGRNFIRILPLAGIRLIFLSELCFFELKFLLKNGLGSTNYSTDSSDSSTLIILIFAFPWKWGLFAVTTYYIKVLPQFSKLNNNKKMPTQHILSRRRSALIRIKSELFQFLSSIRTLLPRLFVRPSNLSELPSNLGGPDPEFYPNSRSDLSRDKQGSYCTVSLNLWVTITAPKIFERVTGHWGDFLLCRKCHEIHEK